MLSGVDMASAHAGGLLGTHNLLAVPEPRHGYLRRLIMPAFSPEAITLLVPRMEAVLDKYLNRWAVGLDGDCLHKVRTVVDTKKWCCPGGAWSGILQGPWGSH